MDLYCCNTGASEKLMQLLADRLHVTIRGFNRGVEWKLYWEGEAPHRHITKRGIDDALPTPDITKKQR